MNICRWLLKEMVDCWCTRQPQRRRLLNNQQSITYQASFEPHRRIFTTTEKPPKKDKTKTRTEEQHHNRSESGHEPAQRSVPLAMLSEPKQAMVHHCTREKNKPMTLPCNKQHVSPCTSSLDALPVRATIVLPTGRTTQNEQANNNACHEAKIPSNWYEWNISGCTHAPSERCQRLRANQVTTLPGFDISPDLHLREISSALSRSATSRCSIFAAI